MSEVSRTGISVAEQNQLTKRGLLEAAADYANSGYANHGNFVSKLDNIALVAGNSQEELDNAKKAARPKFQQLEQLKQQLLSL